MHKSVSMLLNRPVAGFILDRVKGTHFIEPYYNYPMLERRHIVDKIVPMLLKVFNGAPDLTVDVVPAKSVLYGGAVSGIPQDSSLVTITVRNRLSFFPGPVVAAGPNTLPVFGSDAKGVMVSIELSPGLHQVGNISVPVGFQASVLPPNNQTIFCWGGTIPAGASVDFVIDIIGDSTNGANLMISTEVDPYGWIQETSKGNNKGSATVFVVSAH